MKVAITGVTGFVGRRLFLYLRSRGIEVLPFSRRPGAIDGTRCQIVDYADAANLQNQLTGVDLVVHLGGLAHKIDGSRSLEDYIEANVANTLTLAKVSREAKVRRFIFASSIAVNGSNTNNRDPFSEDDIPLPVTHYGKSKFIAENEIKNILNHSDTDFVVFRPPLIYGSGCPGNFKTLLKLTSLMRFLPFGALDAKKSMIYIDNFLDAILHSLQSPLVANQVFIISDFEVLSLSEIIDILMFEIHGSNALNLKIPPSILDLLARVTGNKDLWKKFTSELEVNTKKFSNIADWSPPFNVSEGLKRCARDFK
jgi:nucleoside-diphosphate-sugar epimerase